MEDQPSPEEREASERLEEAIRNWYRVSSPKENAVVVGWILVADLIRVESRDPNDGYVETSASDGLSIINQLGLLAYAEEIAKSGIRKANGLE